MAGQDPAIAVVSGELRSEIANKGSDLRERLTRTAIRLQVSKRRRTAGTAR